MQSQTHDLTFTATEVRKRYVSWDDGEADREWACLTVLAEHAAGVAPRPLRRESEAGSPVIVMERLDGEPLGSAPLTEEQTEALGRTLRRVYDVPLDAVRAVGIGERRYGPSTQGHTIAAWLGEPYDLAECRDPELVAGAMDAALAWLATSGQQPTPRLTALGIADLNPANVLWDGTTCQAGRLRGLRDNSGVLASIRVGPRPGDLGRVLEMHGRLYADEFGYDEEFEAHVANGLAGFADALGKRREDPSLPEPGWLWIAEDTTEDRTDVVGMIALTVEGDGVGRLYTSLGFRRTDEVPGHRFGQDLVEVRFDLDLAD